MKIIVSITTNTRYHTTYTILGNKQRINIKYLERDSIYENLAAGDIAYPKNLMNPEKILSLSKTEQINLFDTVDSLYDIHSRHIIKNISLKRQGNLTYSALVDSVLHADSTYLTPDDKRIWIDGTNFQIKINEYGKVKRYYAHSPTSQTHPLLYNFLNATVALFGQKLYHN